MDIKEKRQKRVMRHKRVRSVIKGTAKRPRLSVFRSSNHIYVQLVDDARGVTIFSVSDMEKLKISKKESRSRETTAFKIGEILAKKAIERGIDSVVFDRGGYKYHGRIKALAEGARQGGLKF